MTVETTHEHVVKDTQVGDERACLWDQGRTLRVATVDGVDQGRLAGAGASDDGHLLARLDREGDVVQDGCAAVTRADSVQRDGGRHGRHPQSSLVAAATCSIGAYCPFDAGMNLLRAK